MNWGRYLALTNSVLCLTAAVCYALSGDYRRALYNLFGGLISATVAW